MTENFDIFDLDGCGTELVFSELCFPSLIGQVNVVKPEQS